MQIFKTPFSRAYWRQSLAMTKDLRMWVLAALITAMRIALKSVRIPIMENLVISVGFLPNAVGSMLYGPFIALLSGFVSDLLGALLFPIGPYFPPFALVEMAGSLLFALFLFRAPITVWRIAAAKLSVNVICNILLTPMILAWMQGKAAQLLSLPRIAKNVLLFPLEAVLLCVLINALLPALKKMRLIPEEQARLALGVRHYVMLGILFVLSALFVYLYYRHFILGAA